MELNLHNSSRYAPHGQDELDYYPLYGRDNSEALRQSIASRTGGGDGWDPLRSLVKERTRPSKKLLDHVAEEIDGHPAFTLLEDQLVAYEVTRRRITAVGAENCTACRRARRSAIVERKGDAPAGS